MMVNSVVIVKTNYLFIYFKDTLLSISLEVKLVLLLLPPLLPIPNEQGDIFPLMSSVLFLVELVEDNVVGEEDDMMAVLVATIS